MMHPRERLLRLALDDTVRSMVAVDEQSGYGEAHLYVARAQLYRQIAILMPTGFDYLGDVDVVDLYRKEMEALDGN